MKTLYACEPGIKLWEQPSSLATPDFVTFSLIDSSIAEIWETWLKFATALASEWPTLMKWRTAGYSIASEKVQELRLRKEIEKTLKKADLLEKNDTTKIYSYIQFNKTQSISFNPNELTQHRNTIIILTKENVDIRSIWRKLCKNDNGITSQGLLDFLIEQHETLIARFIESDIHSAAQIITPSPYSNKIDDTLNNLRLKKIDSIRIPEAIQSL
ncbi:MULTISPECIES: hypothetical protein [unclassified Pseudomonas]|uniref:hypothetical protein n=1 Tax=unclassified Pseudomonas TaxID=196821 RepID=UPI00111C3D70|nr:MULTISPECIES: hypothetical protein [unclassified Pseudomonas]